jgi:hypothetical protein
MVTDVSEEPAVSISMAEGVDTDYSSKFVNQLKD